MNARIEIETRTLGETSRFSAIGNLKRRAGGAAITYPIEGDISTLELFEREASISRCGKASFEAVFRDGESSVFRLTFGENVAEIPVFTSVYNISFQWPEIFAELVYELKAGQPSQSFSLKIHIEVLSEEQ